MYVAEERTIAGAVVTTPKAFGFTPTGSTLIDESGNLEAGKQYIVTVAPTTGNEADYDNGNNMLAEKVFADTSHIFRGGNSDDVAIADDAGNMLAGDVLVVTTAMPTADFNGETVVRFREVLTGTNAFVAGESYTISSLGGSNGEVDMDNFALTQTANHSLDAGAIGRAVTGIVDGDTLAVGQTFTVDVDASTAEMAGLNALTQGMTFKKTTTDAGFRVIDASEITRNIEAVQKKINTARVQAGSQYAALESAVIYTTDLTAQYELGYNTVHDVNFSMETAHLAKNQILQQAATAMLAQANQGQQGLLQLIQG
jgi:flagellin